LLILDIAQPFTDASSGVLVNDVAERLEPVLQRTVKEHPNLQVLTACSPGQVSLVSEDLGHSVLAYYLLRGLHGEADGRNPENQRNGQVSLTELVDYVTAEVDRWAWVNRRLRQTPQFYGERREYRLLANDESEVAAAPLDPAYPEWLRKRWEVRDRWWADQSFRAAPTAFRQMESLLLRADEQWRGGGERERIEKDLADPLARLEERRNEGLRNIGWPEEASSLAQMVAFKGQKRPDLNTGEALDSLRELTQIYARAQQPKPQERDQVKLETETAAFLKKYENKPFELSCTLFDALANELSPKPEQVQLTAELLRKGARKADFAEVRFLMRLAELKPEKPGDWPVEAVRTALQLVAEAEKARAAHPSALAWVKEERRQADDLRQTGLDLLLSGRDAKSWEKAPAAIAAALRAFQTLNQELEVVQAAQRARDEGFVLLPSYATYLETATDPALEKAWQDGVQAALALQEILAQPVKPDTVLLGKMGDLTEAWRTALKKLRQPMDPARLKRIMNQTNKPAPADWWEMSALLALPWPTTKERAALSPAWRGLGARLQKESLDSGLPSLESDRAQRLERERGLLRARCSVALLKLAQAADDANTSDPDRKMRREKLAKVEEALTKATHDPAALSALAGQLQQAWQPFRAGR
jgi:hypothetical protein